ncbi:hypothetical protein [Clostridium intestinale]|uniref:Uncharacterized protein n=1 Tax=Clostridium intestinale TaxID=36845 RepID=A0A7D6VZL4_9CLOT|nr:hypothetical protein [Clostridium intestinale]QLY79431.1 hypothetical protein HZF06_20715 [Clostridium intestinale]
MNDREALELLNSVEYSEEEIKKLEEKAISRSNSIGEDLYKIKNDRVLRNIAFIELERKIKSYLEKDENIKYKMMVLQSYLEKKIFARYVGDWGGKVAIYMGLLVTNKRIFVFRLDHFYEVLEEYSNDINNLESFTDLWKKCDTISLNFKDGKNVFPRPFEKENKEIFLDMIRYLRESTNAPFVEIKRPKVGVIFWIMAVLALAAFIGIGIDAFKLFMESLRNIP